MKTLLTFFVLFFSSSVVADDIRDFQIEEMSIGDSLLDYFSEEEILNKINSYDDRGYIYPLKDFYAVTFVNNKKFLVYDDVQFSLKDKDNTFIIYGLMGIINHKNNIKDCYQKLSTIEEDLDLLFKNSNKTGKYEYFHKGDKSGKSKITAIHYKLDTSESVFASCADWSEEMKIMDALRVSLSAKDYNIWINNLY